MKQQAVSLVIVLVLASAGTVLGGDPLAPTAVPGDYSVPEGSAILLDGTASLPPESSAAVSLSEGVCLTDPTTAIGESTEDLDNPAAGDPISDLSQSVLMIVPTGCTIGFYDDTGFGGSALTYEGEGISVGWPDLDNCLLTDGTPEANRDCTLVIDDGTTTSASLAISSVEFDGLCEGAILEYEWDLNDDGSYDAQGPLAEFSAALIDGPATATVGLKVDGNYNFQTDDSDPQCPEAPTGEPEDPISDTAETVIMITNVDPTIVDVTLELDIPEGDTVALVVTFTDPGIADTHTLTIDWGEGDPEVLESTAGEREFSAAHTYLDDNPTGTPQDDYNIQLTLRDDDGGEDFEVEVLTVINLPPVVDAGPDAEIDEYTEFESEGSFEDLGIQDTHTGVVDYCDGDGDEDLTIEDDDTFELSNVYDKDGTFPVSVVITDDDTGSDLDSATVKVLNMDPVFSIPTNQFGVTTTGGSTLYHWELFDSEGGISRLGDTFLTSGVGLDAVDVLSDGKILFSVWNSGVIFHTGGVGNTYLLDYNVYRFDPETGEITSEIDWLDDWGIDLRKGLDAIDQKEDGSYIFSTRGTRFVLHTGGSITLRPENAYRIDADGVITLYFDGEALGLTNLDGIHAMEDGRVAFSVEQNIFVLTGATGMYLRHQNVYMWDAGAITSQLSGQSLSLLGLDALTLGVKDLGPQCLDAPPNHTGLVQRLSRPQSRPERPRVLGRNR